MTVPRQNTWPEKSITVTLLGPNIWQTLVNMALGRRRHRIDIAPNIVLKDRLVKGSPGPLPRPRIKHRPR